jgi:hypothetical protein
VQHRESKWWRPTGIAPASPACKAGALLLSYGPECLVDPGGSAPPSPDCEPGALLVERWARECSGGLTGSRTPIFRMPS